MSAEHTATQEAGHEWTVTHNGKSVSAQSLTKAMVAARSLRSKEEELIAAQNLLQAVDEELAQEAGQERELPRVWGVTRDAESPGGKTVLVAFERQLSDDELRALHGMLSAQDKPQEAGICDACGLTPSYPCSLCELPKPQEAGQANCPECNVIYPYHDLDCKTGRERGDARAAQEKAAQAAPAVPDRATMIERIKAAGTLSVTVELSDAEADVLDGFAKQHDMSQSAVMRQALRTYQMESIAMPFWRKHAMQSMARPSCFKCGSNEHDAAITHLELPNIYICAPCAAAPSAPSVSDETVHNLMFAIFDNRKVAFEFYKFAPDHVGEGRGAARVALIKADDELRKKVRAMLAAAPSASAVPEVLFDGYAVLQALDDKAKLRTSPENVSDVLDAVVKLIRAAASAPAQEKQQ